MFFYLLELCIYSVYIAYGHEAALARTFVDDIFGGVLVSTVTCNECNSVSLVTALYGCNMHLEKLYFSFVHFL